MKIFCGDLWKHLLVSESFLDVTKELAAIKVSRIAITDGDHEEFITRAHFGYLAATIPGAKLIALPNMIHFPRGELQNIHNSIIGFLDN